MDNKKSPCSTIINNIENQSPGYIISVIEKDSCIFSKGYGKANLENEIVINDKSTYTSNYLT